MVWKNTTKIGCGAHGSYLTCRYYPPGNYIGQFEQNVLPLVGDQSGGSGGNDGTDSGDTGDNSNDSTTCQDTHGNAVDTYGDGCDAYTA